LQYSILIANRIKRRSVYCGIHPIESEKGVRKEDEEESQQWGCIGAIKREKTLCCTRAGEARGDGGAVRR